MLCPARCAADDEVNPISGWIYNRLYGYCMVEVLRRHPDFQAMRSPLNWLYQINVWKVMTSFGESWSAMHCDILSSRDRRASRGCKCMPPLGARLPPSLDGMAASQHSCSTHPAICSDLHRDGNVRHLPHPRQAVTEGGASSCLMRSTAEQHGGPARAAWP